MIIKYIDFEPIIYTINLDDMSSSKVFSKCDLSILCITNLNQ